MYAAHFLLNYPTLVLRIIWRILLNISEDTSFSTLPLTIFYSMVANSISIQFEYRCGFIESYRDTAC